MATASSRAQASKPTPQQRAIEKKRAIWREVRTAEGSGAGDFDLDTYDWEKDGQHFDKLSDDEWGNVWKHVRAASHHREPSADEVRVRELVDDAACSSGWFAEWGGELQISSADYRRFATEHSRFLKKAQRFRQEMAEFLGAPPDDHKEPYDPWDKYRPIVPLLDQLAARLKVEIAEKEHLASNARDAPNASKPKLDIWRARLVLAWQNECHLPVKNTKPLKGFLLAALEPYMPRVEMTDRMAKHFIKRWLDRKVTNPGESRLSVLADK